MLVANKAQEFVRNCELKVDQHSNDMSERNICHSYFFFHKFTYNDKVETDLHAVILKAFDHAVERARKDIFGGYDVLLHYSDLECLEIIFNIEDYAERMRAFTQWYADVINGVEVKEDAE